jgi:hypothetical protein
MVGELFKLKLMSYICTIFSPWIFISNWWYRWRLLRWARSEGVVLVMIDWVFPWSNPFGVGSALSNSLITFRVIVRDNTDQSCEGWVKFGSFWWVSSKRKVLWQDRKPYEKRLTDKLKKTKGVSKGIDKVLF